MKRQSKQFKRWLIFTFVLIYILSGVLVPKPRVAEASSGTGTYLSRSADDKYILYKNDNGDYYVNDKKINMSWSRVYSYSYSGGSHYRSQSASLSSSNLLGVEFVKYVSTYTGTVENAFRIRFDNFNYLHTLMVYTQSGTSVGVWDIDRTDVYGSPTPVQTRDYGLKEYLIVNADTGAVIDYDSNENVYYYYGSEKRTVTVKPQGTGAVTAPAAVDNVTSTPASNSVSLSWPYADRAMSYEIEENGVTVSSGSASALTRSGLTPNTEYIYRIRAVNSAGPGEWSSPITVKTLLSVPVVTALSSNNEIILNWAAVANAETYEVECDGVPVNVGAETSYTLTGLTPSTEHTYRVRAISSDNASVWSTAAKLFTTPAVPANLTVTPTSSTLAVAWTGVTGATAYDVEINGAVSGSPTTTSYNKTGLVSNTDYVVRVRAKNTGGNGDWSAPVTVKTSLITPAVTAISTSSQTTLSWAAITGATGYEIDVDGTVVDNGTELSYTHSGLTPSTSHTYKVRAKSEDNASAWSAAVSKYTTPAAVGPVTVIPTVSTLAISWAAVTGATGYDVEINGAVAASPTAISYSKTALAANTEYTVRVRAKNTGGTGEYSAPVTLKTLLVTPVPAAISTSSQVTVSWAAIAGAAGYEIDADGTVVDNGTELSYTHSGLTPSTSHTYKVRAKSEDNASAWSAAVSKYTTPAAAGTVTVTPASTSLAITWTAIPGATAYDVEINGSIAASPTAISYTKTGLTSNTEYTVRVRAKNNGGLGEWGTPVTLKTLLVTPTAAAVSTSSQVTVSWAAIAGATGYEIDVDGTVVDNGTELSYTHSGLTPSTMHTYKVRAKSEDNVSAWTAAVSKYTTPAAVGPVTVVPTVSTLAVSWPAVTGATGYDVEINGTLSGSSTTTSYSKTALPANTEYTVRVRAKNTGGTGEYSAPVTLKTLLVTPTVTTVSTSSQVTVSWAAITGAAGYEIDVDGTVVDNGTELSYTHNGLTPSTSHTYKVRAKSEDNASAWTAAVSKYTTPAAVGPVTVVPTVSSLAVSWAAVTGATGYDVEINGAAAGSVTTLSFSKTGLVANTEYTVRVRAKNTGGTGDYSAPVTLKTLLVTPTPAAVSTSSQVTVSWAAIAGATGYEIDVDGTVVDNGTELSYTHSGLTPSTTHTYKVRAKSEDNVSAWSAAVSKYTTPAAVGPVTVVPTVSTLAVSWPAVTGATGYDVEINGAIAASPTTTSYSKTALAANTEYTVRVRAKNTGGTGEYSAPVTQKTQLVTPVTTTVSTSSQVTVSWAAIAGATGYEIDVDGTVVNNGTELSYTHSGLTPSTSHTYKVRAKSEDNASAWTAAVIKYTTPTAVGPVTVVPTVSTLGISWAAVTGATGYDVEINGVIAASPTTASYSKTGLVANTEYTVRVRAKNTGGTGEYSTPVTLKTQLVTPVPTTVSASSQVTVSWAAIAGATGYEIDVDGTVVDNGTELSYTHSGLTPSTSHTYKVRAKSEDNVSAWTAAVSKYTTPAAVGPVTVVPTVSSLAVSWSAVTGATGYDVEINGAAAGSVTTLSFSKTGLVANTEYTVRVRAKNTGGTGEYSAPVTLKTQLVTPVPTTVSTSSQVTVSWAAIAGATGYEIDVDGTVVNNGTELSYTHSGLTPSTSHTYKVRAKSEDNASAWTAAVIKYTTPTAVGLVTVVPTVSTLGISWAAVTGATGYDVEINGAIAASPTTASYSKTALAANTEYTVRVRAKNTGGTGEYSAPVTLKTQLVTPVPTTVSTSSQVTVSWAAIAGATGYEIDVDGTVINNGVELSYTHSGLTPSTSHTYKVRAKSEDNVSAWSTAVSKYTTPTTVGVVTVTPAATSLAASWTAVTGATGYDVEINGTVAGSVTTVSFSKAGLAANTEYTVRVRAKNNGGTGEYSAPVTLKTLLVTPTPAAVSTSSQVTVSWAAIAGATGYEIDVDGTVVNNGTELSYTHSGLTPSTSHTYKVRAKSEDNVSAWSTAVSKYTTPAAVGPVTVIPTSASLAASWTAVTGATGYDVEINGTLSGSSTTTSYSKTALAANTEYTVRVRAKNTGGTGEYSAPVTLKTLLVTPTPAAVSTSSQVTVSWATITGATGYEIDVDGTIVNNGTELSYIHSGLTPSTSHTYKVRAKSEDNVSAWSAAVSKYTTPAAVGPVTVVPTVSTLAISWSAVTGATGYDVEINGAAAGSVTTLSFSKTGLVANTEYTVRVRAKNTGGTGDYSAPVTLKTLLVTPTPAAVSTSSQVTVSWAAIAGATGYEIDVDGTVINNGAELSYIHSGLTPSTTHIYKVRAKNEDNVSAWSTAVSKYTIPDAVGGVTVTPTSSALAISWTAVTGATGYDVEINGTVAGSPATASFSKTALAANTEFVVRIRAKNSGGIGDWSNSTVVKTLLTSPVASAASTNNQITVSWGAVAGASGYEIEVDGTVVDAGAASSYIHSDLIPKTTHTYRVRAKSADNSSAWSTVVSKQTLS